MSDRADISPEAITGWANKIKQLRLTSCALILLEAHRPLGFIAGQFLIVGQPVLDLLLPARFTRNMIGLLSQRTYLERLIEELEQG